MQAGYLRTDSSSLWPARDRDRSIIIDTAFTDLFLKYALTGSLTYSGSVGAEYTKTNNLRDNQWDNTFDDYAIKWRNAITINKNTVVSLGMRNTWFNNDIVLNDVEQPDNLSDSSVLS